MAAQGTVTIYRYGILAGDPVEYRWAATYAYLDGEEIATSFSPEVGVTASDQQLRDHADHGLRAKMAKSGEPYLPRTYVIRRPHC